MLIEAAIQTLRQRGITPAYALAKALNEQGITTPDGSRWCAIQVHRIIANGTTERIRVK
jgi:hypothetical protein